MQKVRKRLRELAVKTNGALRYHYSITLDDYNAVLAAQEGVCAICRTNRVTTKSKRLFVDHCHDTGKLRGLLCNHCNMGIGFFKDDVDLMLRAVSYVLAFAECKTDDWAKSVIALIPKLHIEGVVDGLGVEDVSGGRRLGELRQGADYIRDGLVKISKKARKEGRFESVG